ncbi:MotA/TolQ/ExbB proton channel family protein [Campylobacter insulaenigrae]|uniref:MotA/TolQ/ExbB proton channel family protein n=1 Tax=Campylobacter insulaenigrae TaxID=260714 RepID=A0ABY3G5K9_9BACT|nr:MotA/TolQ/ExbB proton channel family protein [Campylobacter insulaenigrae]MCR6572041.1 MotA/TolQ/ExbB proton channel family protein [Campylobacter insulaenigrae]MCR6581083.1 MotA/TolQ/ExbB proton channel family protein [Campylobacter insulaenigrae]MCR6584306.1 MotA/TolQ/ExbB proton channel family protein [Campylobacter insulaenigrae]TWO26163.1 MotA/TolQ/ExbB proton channel family protein [Campylobacter insulaenigrae]
MKKITIFSLFLILCINFLYANEGNANNIAISASEISLDFENLYKNAHIIVKSVIWILILFSIISWTILIHKTIIYKKYFKILKNDEYILQKYDFLDLHFSNKSIILEFLRELNDELEKSEIKSKSLEYRIKQRLKLKVNTFILNTKKSISFLASISSNAPFIGLFGTVWGIMHSFVDIAKTENASLSIIAPGIAEALFATALGLVVAIPSVLFYNYLSRLNISFSNKLNQNVTKLYLLYNRKFSIKDN